MVFRSYPSLANKHVYSFPSTESRALLHPLQNGSVMEEIKPTDVLVFSIDHFSAVDDLSVLIKERLYLDSVSYTHLTLPTNREV